VGDRTASVRIPTFVASTGKGYIEDRRPASNIDPYVVGAYVAATVCGDGADLVKDLAAHYTKW